MADVVVVEDCSVSKEETTGARSSMQRTSDGKIVAQGRYASRPPRIVARQEYLSAILPRIGALAAQKCDCNHDITIQRHLHNMKNLPRLLARFTPISPPS
jgi:hypothetical protein